MKAVSGNLKVLRRWFREESSRFSKASPILILEGRNNNNDTNHHASSSSNDDLTTTAGRHVHLWLAQHLGLRTVISQGASSSNSHRYNNSKNNRQSFSNESDGKGGGSSMFYTETVLREQVELASRIRAGTICAVGDRNAMDLAKAITMQPQSSASELILVPNTYEAVLSSAALNHAIYLHSQEDILLVDSRQHQQQQQQQQQPASASLNTTILTLPSQLFEKRDDDDIDSSIIINKALLRRMQIALRACVALVWHSPKQQQQQQQHSPQEVLSELQDLWQQVARGVSRLEETNGDNIDDHTNNDVEAWHLATSQHLLHVGKTYLNFGITSSSSSDVRTIPLALAVSLLPTVFADQDLLSIMASCCPPEALPQEESSSSSSLSLLTTEPVEQLLSYIQNNQMEWNCVDAPAAKFKKALQQYTLLQ